MSDFGNDNYFRATVIFFDKSNNSLSYPVKASNPRPTANPSFVNPIGIVIPGILLALAVIFDKHIDAKASITTDLWKGYRPIAKEYDIKQIESNSGKNFKILHIMI